MASPANPSQHIIDPTLGPLVSGVWARQLFLGFILAKMLDYYRYHFIGDLMTNKVIVTALLALNLFGAGTDFDVLYRSTVVFYGDFEPSKWQDWTKWSAPGLAAIIGFLTQLFYVARCQRFVQSYCFTALLSVLVLFSLGSGLAYTYYSASPENDSRGLVGQDKALMIMWLVSTATADVCIAAVLTVQLLRSRSEVFHRKTNAVLTRLTIASMETGAMTAFVAILSLVMFLLEGTRYSSELPGFSISHGYTLAVVITLLSRTNSRALLNEAHAGMPTTLNLPPTLNFNNQNDSETGTIRHDIRSPMMTEEARDIGFVEERNDAAGCEKIDGISVT